MKPSFPILLLLLAAFAMGCKTKPTPSTDVKSIDPNIYKDRWSAIDSLDKKGLYRSALEKVVEIKALAVTEGNSIQLVKAVTRQRTYDQQLEEDAEMNTLLSLEAEIGSYPEPARSILHIYAARWYNEYLNNNLWRISRQTPAMPSVDEDIRTWDVRRLTEKVIAHYMASVAWPGLRTVPVGDYAELLTDGKDSDHLRPTLYDILAHTALDYFSSGQAHLIQPAAGFAMNDVRYFSVPETFIALEVQSPDTLDLNWRAIRLLQDVLAFRLDDEAHTGALIDADVLRLHFVRQHYTGTDRDSLYIAALTRIIDRYVKDPESTLASYAMAQYHADRAAQWSPDAGPSGRFAYREAIRVARDAVERFPDAYGSGRCAQLIAGIESPSLQLQTEDVVLPGVEQLASLRYRNMEDVSLTLVKLPAALRDWVDPEWDQAEMIDRLKRLPVQAAWRHTLEDSADYQSHTTEIPLPAMPFGHYALLVSGKPKHGGKLTGEGSALFTVSRIGYWMLQDRGVSTRGVIVDRLTGDPVDGVKVECYTPEQNGRFYRAKPKLFATLVSDANGFVHLPNTPGRSLTFRFTKGADELYPDQGIYGYGEPRTGRNETSLFFTDRAIYRPGQKVFFKGYAVTFDADRMPSVAANQSVSVSFRDANNQEIAVRAFRTNAYGTFSGSFDIPQGILTGYFRLASDFGSGGISIRVEEYKRPKYEVTFDTLSTTPALGETVDLTARAMNYAGSAVAGARYAYTVKRIAQWPWWWRGYRRWPPTGGDEQVLVNAEGTTGNDGSVPIRFDALASHDADPDLRYVFEVHVTVTDISGESHEAIKSFTLSRQGFDVEVGLSDKTEIGALRQVRVQARNADDKPIPLKASLAVTQVQGASTVLRDRLWSVPDMPILGDADYQKRFPSFSPPGLQAMDRWPVVQRFDPVSLAIDAEKPIDLTTVIKSPGHYQLRWTWTDARGKTLTTTQFVTVYSLSTGLPANEFAVIRPESTDLEPGNVLRAAVLSGLKTPPRFFRVIERRKDGAMDWIPADGRMKDLTTIAEADRGGMILHHFAVHDNRFYAFHQPVAVPWSNKELDVRLTTWRDKAEPGGKETWSLTVSGKSGDNVSAEVLMSMYDASLDAFVPHQWSMALFPGFYSRLNTLDGRSRLSPWWMTGQWSESPGTFPDRTYRMLLEPYMAYGGRIYMRGERPRSARADTDMILQAAPGAVSLEEAAAPMDGKGMKNEEKAAGTGDVAQPQQAPPLRTALDETVFFFPEMHTDSAGNLVFTFVMKEALTRWKFQALAHTEQLRFGLTSAETETRKDLMVFPNAPRFFREGDTIAFPAKVTNLSANAVSGSASLRILNALTDEDVTALWGGATELPLSIAPGLSSPVTWTLTVPAGWTLPVKYQVRAAAGNHTDGEEAWVPVVTNRILITETLPLPLKANERRTFVFASMTGKRSPTQVDQGFTVEMTTSPAWYAVQALPYLMEYPHECAEQVFGRYYAHALGARILDLQPDIAKVYEQWRQTDDEALLSPLQKNQDLKSAMLEETPWVRDALGEAQQRRDMAMLFDRNRLAYDLDAALRKLSEMQLPGGGFPWFKGGYDSWYITQYIVEGFGHLRKLGVAADDQRVRDIVQRAMPYLDNKMLEWYREVEKRVKKGDAKWDDHHAGAMQAHYLYTRSFFPEIASSPDMQVAMDFLKKQFAAHWLAHGLYEQGLIALGANRYWPDDALASTITASLRERAVRHDELGRYWKTPAGYFWQDAPIERQSLMIELFQEMKVPQAEIDEYRVWLLKQKQTRQWPSTKSTASAIYALLIHPDAWLRSVGQVTVTMGKDEIMKADDPGQAGSGYVKKQWAGDVIRPDWYTITAANPNAHIAWGAAYWQFWEDIDKVKSAGDPNALKVTRQILKVVPRDRGREAVVTPGGAFAVGDRLMVRITVETDRMMEFVHVKDLRASGVEPLETLSGYRWSGGLGYYQSTRDLATHFFIERLPRGKYVLEYEVFAAQGGHYSAGLTTAQCMYAPEFTDHTGGIRLTVRPHGTGNE